MKSRITYVANVLSMLCASPSIHSGTVRTNTFVGDASPLVVQVKERVAFGAGLSSVHQTIGTRCGHTIFANTDILDALSIDQVVPVETDQTDDFAVVSTII